MRLRVVGARARARARERGALAVLLAQRARRQHERVVDAQLQRLEAAAAAVAARVKAVADPRLVEGAGALEGVRHARHGALEVAGQRLGHALVQRAAHPHGAQLEQPPQQLQALLVLGAAAQHGRRVGAARRRRRAARHLRRVGRHAVRQARDAVGGGAAVVAQRVVGNELGARGQRRVAQRILAEGVVKRTVLRRCARKAARAQPLDQPRRRLRGARALQQRAEYGGGGELIGRAVGAERRRHRAARRVVAEVGERAVPD
ncbi:hypothetical protein FGB62_129g05 [Gracilaria domingensis]|nr:hypothetical protein FGB62_129g05 [Gracilaria domingensis]